MCPRTEDQTVVWTTEIAAAWKEARDLLNAGDEVAARMTFKEAYTRMVAAARGRGDPVKWEVSFGWDKAARVAPVAEAVVKGLVPREHALGMFHEEQRNEFLDLAPGPEQRYLSGKVEMQLPGFYGMLQRLRMEGGIPEGLDAKQPEREPMTDEQIKARKEMLRAQAMEMMRNRKRGPDTVQ